MLNHRCKILGRHFALDIGAGIRAVRKDRAVRKEAGVGDKDYARVRAAIAGKVRYGQCASLIQNQIENNDFKVRVVQGQNRRVLTAHQRNRGTVPLKMPLPQLSQGRFAFDDQNIHVSIWDTVLGTLRLSPGSVICPSG
jgi:hypothetical protein